MLSIKIPHLLIILKLLRSLKLLIHLNNELLPLLNITPDLRACLRPPNIPHLLLVHFILLLLYYLLRHGQRLELGAAHL